MRPHIPATDRVGNGHVIRTNQRLAIPRTVVLLQARLIVSQIFHTFPAVVIIRTAQVVLFLIGPDLILEIIRRAASADTTAVIGIIIDLRVLVFGGRNNSCPGFSVRSFDGCPFGPVGESVTHRINTFISGFDNVRISHHVHETFCIVHVYFSFYAMQVMHQVCIRFVLVAGETFCHQRMPGNYFLSHFDGAVEISQRHTYFH